MFVMVVPESPAQWAPLCESTIEYILGLPQSFHHLLIVVRHISLRCWYQANCHKGKVRHSQQFRPFVCKMWCRIWLQQIYICGNNIVDRTANHPTLSSLPILHWVYSEFWNRCHHDMFYTFFPYLLLIDFSKQSMKNSCSTDKYIWLYGRM